MRKLLFATMLLVFGCTSQSEELIILQGNIDSKVNGRLELTRSGDKITGTFENTDEQTRLELRGTINGEYLRLEEFAEKDKLTGIFDGKYDGEEYSGDWISPNLKRKVPFFFTNRELSSPTEKATTEGREDATQAIVKEYSKWAKHKNQTEYCSPLRCEETREKERSGREIEEDDCGLCLEEKVDPKNILLGDINNDQKVDGIVTASFAQCLLGTWFVNVAMVGELVIFVSNDEGGYEVFDEPKVIRSEIDMGSVTAIKDGAIYADGGSISGEGSMHDVDITWKSKFKFENGHFVLVSSTDHVQRKDSE